MSQNIRQIAETQGVIPAKSPEQLAMEQELAKLRAENDALKRSQANSTGVGIKVSPKGAVAVYGLGRFPVVLYKTQWDKLLGMTDSIKAFIAQNESLLSVKKPGAKDEAQSKSEIVDELVDLTS